MSKAGGIPATECPHFAKCETLSHLLRKTGEVTVRRMVLLVTCLVVAAFAATFALLTWEYANRVATTVSALAGIAAVGVAVWAALPGMGKKVRVSGTGKAMAHSGGVAISGLSGPASAADGLVEVDRTGDAEAFGGKATSGVSLS
ncbi:hypothetical protein [Nonomuraea jabiensis]|uniref:hypothetical protein n=1 Tax=Nonomuraea jabiensis TaxID=882448 RepID=UPI003D743CE3